MIGIAVAIFRDVLAMLAFSGEVKVVAITPCDFLNAHHGTAFLCGRAW
jgi:hypothetical protein